MKGHALFRRVALSLVPVSREARELLAAVKDGATIFVEIWSARNMRQHAKYFAVLNNVVQATGRWTSSEHLRRDVLLALHRYDEHVNQFTGEVSKVPHSVEVSMGKGSDQVMFTVVYADGYRRAYWLPFWKACWHAWKLILRGVKVEDRL